MAEKSVEELVKGLNDYQDSIKKRQLETKQSQERQAQIKAQQERLKAQLEQANNHYQELQDRIDQNANDEQQDPDTLAKINEQLAAAREQRNQDLVTWWMETYPEFNDWGLERLKAWLTEQIKRKNKPTGNEHRYHQTTAVSEANGVLSGITDAAKAAKPVGVTNNSATSSANNQDAGPGQVATLDVQKKARFNETAQSMVVTPDSNGAGGNATQFDQEPESVGMTLAERNRTFTNQDENNPIDTQAEVNDVEERARPFGNRYAEDEAARWEAAHQPDAMRKAALKKQEANFDLEL